jgi:hypothetical protein
MKIVLKYNNIQLNNHGVLSSDNYKIEENDWFQLNLIQHLTDNYNKIIIEIDYPSPLNHIIVVGFVYSITVNQNQLVSLTCKQVIEMRRCIFKDFQAVLQQNMKYLFLPDVNILSMLESLVTNDDNIVVSFYRIANDAGHFHALQPKTKKRETIHNNNVDINISDYLGENNLSSSTLLSSSIPIEFNNNINQSIISNNNNLLSITPFEDNNDNNIEEVHPNKTE